MRMLDEELDEALGHLGLPEGVAPRTSPQVLVRMARARRGTPVTRAPWTTWGPGLLAAAGLLAGFGLGGSERPVPVGPANSPADASPVAPVPAGALAAAPGPGPASVVATPAPAPLREEVRPVPRAVVSTRRTRSRAPEERSALAPAVAVEPVGPEAAPASEPALAEAEPALAEAEPALADAWAADEAFAADLDLDGDALPRDGDRRLTRPDRLPRDAAELVEVETERRRPAAVRVPLGLRLWAAGGGAPSLDDGGGAAMGAGLAWSPATAAVVRPELWGDVGVGAFADAAGFRGEPAHPATWSVEARVGAGLGLGGGWVRGSVGWTGSLHAPLDGSPLGVSTGPLAALVLGRPGAVNGRVGVAADLADRRGPDAGLRAAPSVFVALEVPLGDEEKE